MNCKMTAKKLTPAGTSGNRIDHIWALEFKQQTMPPQNESKDNIWKEKKRIQFTWAACVDLLTSMSGFGRYFNGSSSSCLSSFSFTLTLTVFWDATSPAARVSFWTWYSSFLSIGRIYYIIILKNTGWSGITPKASIDQENGKKDRPFQETIWSPQGFEQQDAPQLTTLLPCEANSRQWTGSSSEAKDASPLGSSSHLQLGIAFASPDEQPL